MTDQLSLIPPDEPPPQRAIPVDMGEWWDMRRGARIVNLGEDRQPAPAADKPETETPQRKVAKRVSRKRR